MFVPFNVPAGITQVRVNYCYDDPDPGATDDHTLDLGVYEPRPSGDTGPWGPDEFRGWGGSGYDAGEHHAAGLPRPRPIRGPDRKVPVEGLTTRSFMPGPIPAGLWAVELGLANIAGAPRPRRRRLAGGGRPLHPRGRSGVLRAGPRPEPAVPAAGWYAGDFHAHAEHSGDGNATVTETMNYGFGTAGLDFITLSDHNTGTGWPDTTAGGPTATSGGEAARA